ncbi:MAG TPA: class I mannose-6-phosphate isomerase [Defluviitoga tunisiensis]|nr:class I mannose-6-phosphate isomerase [Defluviitoga tunisiensis]HOB55590.1 class I mannose-6-phosphate isomerase [Defluviitoga tunisiensis]HPZ66688.1 class I mannose-6-phosphate isomerase [Defluviitoga tunisiensis]HQD43602.1 class I mannose-6-phosphate isomerase [Defluviitoga tunisiensis]
MKITEPLISKPIFSEKVWGSETLNEIFKLKTNEKIGEVWLYSGLNNYETELVGKDSGQLYGKPSELFPHYPLLLKLIATSSWLSIQLHPDDEIAKQIENQQWGKSEAWFFLKDKGRIKVSNDNPNLLKALEDNSWDDFLEEFEMNKNDIIYIPAGTVHTLGPNSLLLEIQQSSDLTYRLYDWGRPREIHVEKSKMVLKRVKSSYAIARNSQGLQTKYFSFMKFANQIKKGWGLFVDLNTFETIVLSEDTEYLFKGEFVEFRMNNRGWDI